MRVFLTGGSGLVGRAVVAGMAERGVPARALLRGEPAGPLPAGLEAVRGDLLQPAAWLGALAGCDAVIHAAGAMPRDEAATFALNRDATRALFDAARRAGARRFVYVSSAAVYGDDEHHLATEQSPRRGTGAYARSKIEAEDHVLQDGRDGLRGLVLRPCMITGPGDRNLLPALQALAGQPVVTLPNHGAAPLDLVDARDLAWALLRVAIDDVGAGAYNVTGGCPRPLRQILEGVAAQIGASPQWRGLSLDDARLELARAAAEGRPPAAPAELIHVASCERTCSIEKAERELGYQPRFTPP